MKFLIPMTGLVASIAFLGCEKMQEAPKESPKATTTSPPIAAKAPERPNENHDHKPGESHAADHKEGDGHENGKGGHGEIIELGTATTGSLTVRASRDKAEIKPGGDAPIDVWLTTADGKPAQVAAVRFWVGTEDAKGSVKAKAEIEDPKQPNHWHTHVEVPEPMPTGSKLWVEIEETSEKKTRVSFDMKP